MKRIVSLVIITALLCAVLSIPAFAADDQIVYVTISDDKGALQTVQEPIALSDTDADGALTIADALYLAHEKKYDGGASAGFASEMTQYGLSLTKLWGVANGGSYGYYVNNISAMSLGDTVKGGDYINAYVFQDPVTYADVYCYFDKFTAEISDQDTIELTLSAATFDANWSPITVPVEGAYLTVDGEKTDFVTDKDGKVSFTLSDAGTHTVSAKSETQTLVPPAAVVTVSKTEEETAAPDGSTPDEPATPDSSTQDEGTKGNPNAVATGSDAYAIITLTIFALLSAFLFFYMKKKA